MSLLAKPARLAASGLLAVLPRDAGVRVARYERGWEESTKLAACDAAVVSYAKAGRTWLRVLLSRYFHLRHGVPDNLLLDSGNFRRASPTAKYIHFTHDNYIDDYLGKEQTLALFRRKTVVLLVRDPIDIAASQYFQWKHRMRPVKLQINGYPDPAQDIPIFDFAMSEKFGVPRIVAFHNRWIDAYPSLSSRLAVRYESLKRDTAGTLRHILELIGESPTADDLARCVEFASVENMRRLEADGHFKDPAGRLSSRNAGNPQASKVRTAAAGAAASHFTAEQMGLLRDYVSTHLKPGLGYAPGPEVPGLV
jgi:Sulfotransferase domain